MRDEQLPRFAKDEMPRRPQTAATAAAGAAPAATAADPAPRAGDGSGNHRWSRRRSLRSALHERNARQLIAPDLGVGVSAAPQRPDGAGLQVAHVRLLRQLGEAPAAARLRDPGHRHGERRRHQDAAQGARPRAVVPHRDRGRLCARRARARRRCAAAAQGASGGARPRGSRHADRVAGMEVPTSSRQAYDVVAFDKQGQIRVFASH